jgi:hypothetical protein
MQKDFKLWPVASLPLAKVKKHASELVFDNNSVVFGYTIRIPKEVYDNALKCSRSYKVINNSMDTNENMYGQLFRKRNTSCYFKLTCRIPYRKVSNVYELAIEKITYLKQLSMIRARQLKELYSESERNSLSKGEMTSRQVQQQIDFDTFPEKDDLPF